VPSLPLFFRPRVRAVLLALGFCHLSIIGTTLLSLASPLVSLGYANAGQSLQAEAVIPFWYDTQAAQIRVLVGKLLQPGPAPYPYRLVREAGPRPQAVLEFQGARLLPQLAAQQYNMAFPGSPFLPFTLEERVANGVPLVRVVFPFASQAELNQVALVPVSPGEIGVALPKPALPIASAPVSTARTDVFPPSAASIPMSGPSASLLAPPPTGTLPTAVSASLLPFKQAQPTRKTEGLAPQAPQWQAPPALPVPGASASGEASAPIVIPNGASVVQDVRVAGEWVQLAITGQRPLKTLRQFTLENPRRLVLDFGNAYLASKDLNRAYTNLSPRLKSARLSQFETGVVRLVLETNVPEGFRLVSPPAGSVAPYMVGPLRLPNPSLEGLGSAYRVPQAEGVKATMAGLAAAFETSNRRTALQVRGSGPMDVLVHQNGRQLVLELFNVAPPAQPQGYDVSSIPSMSSLTHQPSALTGPGGSQVVVEGNALATQLSIEPNASKTEWLVYFYPASSFSTGGASVTAPKPSWQQPRPNTGKPIVVVDAGHGGKDQGASRNGILEKSLNLAVALRLRSALEAKGYTVLMTRTEDVFLPLSEITGFTNNYMPDVFVSVHHNTHPNSATYGLETYYYTAQSVPLARSVHTRLVSMPPVKDNNVRKAMFYVIHHTPVPAILCELGYMSNSSELSRLADPQVQALEAEAISQGVADYLKSVGR
jgi:N-acetylmuramoyl-L-alanine amidase